MTTEYSIQKMVSDGTLSTIALGIQYLQRNDIYMRIAGEETPQSGAPSGYTWSFVNNTTLKILPVVPNGVEVVVYRRTDVDAMYNVYSQNAQFDEATIDENNQQLLYIAQEYLEQGLPGAGVDTIEFLRDDGTNTYYRIKRTDGSYSEEFTVPSASSSTKILAREALRRSYAEAGYKLVDGSFEAGGTLVNTDDVLLQEASGKAYSGGAGFVAAWTDPTSGGFIDRSGEVLINKINMNSNNGFVGSADVSSSILILGDSITEAVGASTYANGYSYQLARSLLNHRDKGYSNDSGFYWHTDINQANAVNTGLSSNGTLVSDGVTAKRRSLAVGQSINITGRKFNSVYVVYDGATSSGSIEIQRNGVVISTQAVVGSSLNVTNVVVNNWSEGDSLSVVAVAGTVVVCGVMTLKTAAGASLVYIAGRSGAGYQDFTTASAINEIGYWLNLLKAGNEKVLVLNAGTNNIYNSGKAKTPNKLVSEISTLISGVNSNATSVKYVIAVPPKADESIFPVVLSNFRYEDYVSAIVNFANQNGHGLIRYDLTGVSERTSYYSDGVHPSNVGHRIMAAAACEAFGVPLNSYVRVTAPTVGVISQVDITMSSSWGPYNGAVGSRGSAQLQNNTASLFGIVQPNGSTSLTIGVIPAGYRPTRACYFVARANTGPVNLTITSGGELVVESIPTWLSLEGLTYPITRV